MDIVGGCKIYITCFVAMHCGLCGGLDLVGADQLLYAARISDVLYIISSTTACRNILTYPYTIIFSVLILTKDLRNDALRHVSQKYAGFALRQVRTIPLLNLEGHSAVQVQDETLNLNVQ